MSTTTAHNPIAPPSRLLQLLEGRAAFEMAGTLAAWPLLAMAPRGDGHTVLVLPGLVASDLSTRLLRRFLRERGYVVHGWGLGRNYGPRPGVREAMLELVDRLHAEGGRKLSLVGWSLGGAYARFLAAKRPEAVRNVITLGSPVNGDARSTRARRLYEFASGRRADDSSDRAPVRAALAMPSTSIWSKSDAIVSWRASVLPPGEQAENIEVLGSHLGLGVHAPVLYAVADRLAQPEGAWQPFAPRLALRMLYPDVRRGARG
jgi:pimeloyl-ACP methyl ester carboxylesterase